MKRTSTKAAAKRAGKGLSAVRKPADLNAIRQTIANLVGSQAVRMVETTIGEVDKGHYAAMKYLFEMIGLFPGSEEVTATDGGVLAKTLWRRLGLPEETKADVKVTKETESSEGEDRGFGRDAVE